MLRASWALISLPFLPGARSRLDTTFLPPSLHLWRQFASSPQKFNARLTGTVPLEDSDEKEATIDTFTPSMPPSFRFPPFPLAAVENPEPESSVEVQAESDTDIYESTSAEYRVQYERMPTHSVNVLTQVARSLPELLPEPETDPASIFEDKSHTDYANISISFSHPVTSTQGLELLVVQESYDHALRLLDELVEVGTEIPFSSSYERAALVAVTAPAQTKAEVDDQLLKFRKWFSLIPLADGPPSSAFRAIRERIMLSTLHSLPLIMEFGLIAAEKGYIQGISSPVVNILSMYGEPDVTLEFINELRRRHRLYLERTSNPDDIEKQDRKLQVEVMGAAVRTLASAGRFDHAIQLVPDPKETVFHFTPYTYQFLLAKLQRTRDPRYLPHIKFVAQHKSQKRFRSAGLNNMDKGMVALAIRCLAKEGRLDFSQRLLSRLEGVTVEPVTLETLARLDVGDGHVTGSEEGRDYDVAIRALTKAWCLDEALSLLPAYHRDNSSRSITLYNLLLWKLKASGHPKYHSDIQKLEELSDLARKAKVMKREAERRPRAARVDELREQFEGEDFQLASSLPSSAPARLEHDLAATLWSLAKHPHPLTVVRFMELYLATGRTRAIPMLRRYVLKRIAGTWSYLLAELLFHARNGNPGLVIQTFVAHFYIVALPRDDIMLQLGKLPPLEGWQAELWASHPEMKLHPSPLHTAVVWRALLGLTEDERMVEFLYLKLVKFASPTFISSAQQPGIPLLHPPPPSWKAGIDSSAFTPFIRRICAASGSHRGPPILREMLNLGITPNVYQLTELAIAYSREGDFPKTVSLLNRAESVDKKAGEENAAVRHVDQVLYIAIVRGLLKSGKVPAAREIERRMFERYGYVAGKDRHLDELYEDLELAESGKKIPWRPSLASVVHTSAYKALLSQPREDAVPGSRPGTSDSAGA
ncbi:hypothetical protein FB45DRAFT_909878 [Roridomyces roridus]|uniref:Pentatricopeptide repeat protein n=1 Tax=Roridomyces roridus TaxID=1738132 RepID=A0AAD7BZ44_9AGAR|nr:hypothetical protein FB45DRAFT_909878 [Roridomyces roridus]